jgi:hypothetical protein
MKRCRWAVLLAAAAAMVCLAIACKDSNSIAAPQTAEIAGAWVGSFDPVHSDPDDPLGRFGCRPGPATATLTQQGATVTGVLTMAQDNCGASGVTLEATVAGSQVSGSIGSGDGSSRYRFGAGSVATGVLSGNTLHLVLHSQDGLAPSGTMHLHR